MKWQIYKISVNQTGCNNLTCNQVGHSSAANEDSILLPQQLRSPTFELIDGRIFTIDIIANDRSEHRLPHLLGGLADGVTSQIYYSNIAVEVRIDYLFVHVAGRKSVKTLLMVPIFELFTMYNWSWLKHKNLSCYVKVGR